MAEELSCLRRHRDPGNAAEVRRSRLCKGKRFNSEIISSMIESLTTAVRGGRPASIMSVTGSICRETTTYDAVGLPDRNTRQDKRTGGAGTEAQNGTAGGTDHESLPFHRTTTM
jgi:hypothetical protein